MKKSNKLQVDLPSGGGEGSRRCCSVSLWSVSCGQDVDTSRMCCGICVPEVEEANSCARAKRGVNPLTEKFASSRQSPRPRWSAFCNEESEECS